MWHVIKWMTTGVYSSVVDNIALTQMLSSLHRWFEKINALVLHEQWEEINTGATFFFYQTKTFVSRNGVRLLYQGGFFFPNMLGYQVKNKFFGGFYTRSFCASITQYSFSTDAPTFLLNSSIPQWIQSLLIVLFPISGSSISNTYI